ncbi:1,4-beta-xylanase [Marivirga lumbricoides]|uniref:Beta-xylanase n=1 Tax=Marivirga lumbricoides TaxID=1046115 RepID=A0A2T4DFM3_9BACT|nr:1,4-beta-xylanase [Marivirga lumbricoides]
MFTNIKKINSLAIGLLCAGSLYFTQCSSVSEEKEQSANGLHEYYSGYFPIGVAVSPRALEDSAQSALILREFNSMTPENVMKAGPIHPSPNQYNWGPADAVSNYAKENDLKLRGHALVWHQQYPGWFFKDENGDQISKDTLYARMKSHITEVVNRYKDVIYAWDVVNEAVSDNSDFVYRQESPYYQIAGEEYLAKAFEFAHAADPQAKLFYNDYNAARPEKVDRIYTLVKKLKDAGVPIHGVGIQGHWSIFEPSEKDLRYAIDKYASLGLDVQITELDVSIYPWEKERRAMKPGESDEFTNELEEKQLKQYDMFFHVFRDYKETLTGVTFWNISDQYTWLDTYPVEGRKNYPLLFDQELKPKKAYYKVTSFDQ